jgi:glutaconate CoA-transferase subunit A
VTDTGATGRAARPTAGKVVALEGVRELVPDGASLFLGGFTLFRSPLGLVRELARARPKDLTIWSHIGGAGIELLLAVDAVRCIRSSYVGLDILGMAPLFTRGATTGAFDFVEETEATLMFGMKATVYRLPFMPSRALVGSQIVDSRADLQEYDCQISGERLVAIPPVRADVCFLHGHQADAAGNVQLYGTLGNDIEIAKVASTVVVSVERVVETAELQRNPELTRLPAHLVDAVVELPHGAYPSSCLPHYDVDYEYFLDYLDAVENGSLPDFVGRHIDGAPFAEYVASRTASAPAPFGRPA